MPFPADLSNVATFKIHPAIGCARLADNPDDYEFFESEQDRPSFKYMSEQNGVQVMKRQSVQYKIFAYDSNRDLLGELDEAAMTRLGIQATWRASVANRKLHNYSKKRRANDTAFPEIPEISASAEATGTQLAVLEGQNPFDPSLKIVLGTLSGSGKFSPPIGGVHRRFPGAAIARYPADESGELDVTDTTSDGSIEVTLTNTDSIPVIPAWVIVAPQEHSPDVNPGNPNLLGTTNLDWTTETKIALSISGDPPDHTASRMDRLVMSTVNGEYNPGMEMSFQARRMEFTDVNDAFYPRDVGPIGPNEIRIQPAGAGGALGAFPGQLTSGLCSTWQGDLVACLDYWTAQFPDEVVRESDGATVFLARENYNINARMTDIEDLVVHADRMGVARLTTGNVNLLAETERDP
jgi:hypothetical protein